MISFRYHIVSIVSGFLALAVGVALGGGPLQGEVDNTLVQQVQADRKVKMSLRSQILALRNGNRFTDGFAKAAAPRLIARTLQNRPVTLVVLPGASQRVVTSIGELIAVAGGSVGGTLRVDEKLLDVANKQLVDQLATQLLEGGLGGVRVADDATGYERMGAVMSRGIGTQRASGARVDRTASSILSGLSTAGLAAAGQVDRRGSLVVVVAGEGRGTADQRQGANTIVSAMLAEIDARTDGVVVAGPAAAARDDGLLSALRGDVVAAREISTVDSVTRAAGQVVSVMALAEQTTGQAGHYGAVDAPDGPMPGAAAK